MPVTKRIPGHWWSDKLLCLRAALLKLEHPSASPGGFVKTQAAGPTCRASDSGGGGTVQVGLTLLVWGPLLKSRHLRMTKGGKPEAEGDVCQPEARLSPRTCVCP